MAWSRLDFMEDPILGRTLVVGGETRKGGAWIARLTGTDPKYKYTREFLGNKEYRGDCVIVRVPVSQLRDGDLLDIRAGGSWKNAYRDYYVYEAGELQPIKEKELRERLAQELKPKLKNRSEAAKKAWETRRKKKAGVV